MNEQLRELERKSEREREKERERLGNSKRWRVRVNRVIEETPKVSEKVRDSNLRQFGGREAAVAFSLFLKIVVSEREISEMVIWLAATSTGNTAFF